MRLRHRSTRCFCEDCLQVLADNALRNYERKGKMVVDKGSYCILKRG